MTDEELVEHFFQKWMKYGEGEQNTFRSAMVDAVRAARSEERKLIDELVVVLKGAQKYFRVVNKYPAYAHRTLAKAIDDAIAKAKESEK